MSSSKRAARRRKARAADWQRRWFLRRTRLAMRDGRFTNNDYR